MMCYRTLRLFRRLADPKHLLSRTNRPNLLMRPNGPGSRKWRNWGYLPSSLLRLDISVRRISWTHQSTSAPNYRHFKWAKGPAGRGPWAQYWIRGLRQPRRSSKRRRATEKLAITPLRAPESGHLAWETSRGPEREQSTCFPKLCAKGAGRPPATQHSCGHIALSRRGRYGTQLTEGLQKQGASDRPGAPLGPASSALGCWPYSTSDVSLMARSRMHGLAGW